MSAAVDETVLVEVDEIDEQFGADDADETRRVPAHVRAGTGREHRQLSGLHLHSTLCRRTDEKNTLFHISQIKKKTS